MRLRRIFFPAKKPKAELLKEATDAAISEHKPDEPEFMQVRVDQEPNVVTPTMRDFANQIIENPAWAAVSRSLRQAQLERLVGTPPHDQATREDAYRQLRAIDDITIALGTIGAPERLNVRHHRLTQPK